MEYDIPRPGPEHAILAELVGNFEGTDIMMPSPWSPEKQERTSEISARYTSPLKLFEGMAAERALIASDLPSLGEVLEHDRNAWMVAPDDPAALAEGLRTLLADASRRDRLAAQARDDVNAYTWTARGAQVARFLRERLTVGVN